MGSLWVGDNTDSIGEWIMWPSVIQHTAQGEEPDEIQGPNWDLIKPDAE